MPEPNIPQRTTAEAGPSLEQIGGSIERLPKQEALRTYEELHSRTQELAQEETQERDKALARLQREIYGASAKVESLTASMKERKKTVLTEEEQRNVQKLQAQLREAEARKQVGELDISDQELDTAFERAAAGPIKQEEAEAKPLNLDIGDIGKRQVEEEVDKAFEALPTEQTLEEEVDTAFDKLQEPPEQKAA